VKSLLATYDKAFDGKVRLGIMSVLMVNESMDFSGLKELLDLSDGNLASHLRALEETKYLAVNKQFIGRKPNTSYSVTEAGRKAFQEHLNALEELIKSQLGK
jgi:DNA-binding HxlR family transcriptional regulator